MFKKAQTQDHSLHYAIHTNDMVSEYKKQAAQWEQKATEVQAELLALKDSIKNYPDIEKELAKVRAELRIQHMEFQAVLDETHRRAGLEISKRDEKIKELLTQTEKKLDVIL